MSKIIYVYRDNCAVYEEKASGDTENISVFVDGKNNVIRYYDENDNLTEYDITEIGTILRNEKITKKIHEITNLTVYYVIEMSDVGKISNLKVCRYDGENYNEYDFVLTLNRTTIVESISGNIYVVDGYAELSVLENIEDYSIINSVLTSSEAEKKWGLKDSTVRSACSRGKLKKYIGTGVKQTDKTWLVMDWVMEKEYGKK